MSKKTILHADYYIKWTDGTEAKIGSMDIDYNGFYNYDIKSKENMRISIGWELIKKGFHMIFKKEKNEGEKVYGEEKKAETE